MSSFQYGHGRITEQEQFGNPSIRFIRKNGRIIPIVNKQKLGETQVTAGKVLLGAGALGVGAAVAEHALKKGLHKVRRKFRIQPTTKLPVLYTGTARRARLHRRISSSAKAIFRTPFSKAALVTAGVGALALGTGLKWQMEARGLDVGGGHE